MYFNLDSNDSSKPLTLTFCDFSKSPNDKLLTGIMMVDC